MHNTMHASVCKWVALASAVVFTRHTRVAAGISQDSSSTSLQDRCVAITHSLSKTSGQTAQVLLTGAVRE